jgi:5-methylcytosine-specific restriction endonuclease McrA
MEQRTCVVDGCDKPRHYAAGWCPMHYQRIKARGTTDPPPPKAKTLCPCGLPARSRGLCRACYRRDHYLRNKDHENASAQSYYAANAERRRAGAVAWRKANPIKRREAQARRKSRMGSDPVDYAVLLAEYGMFCHICSLVIVDESDLHFDHVIPLSLGGPHSAENIRPAHALCNIRKGAKVY